jgi:pyruvate/2-oxoglutarate dehydrogenase complex dihydrolipoamide acyltransferase (E2) component
MKLPKSLIVAAVVAGSLFAGSAVLQAQTGTNVPPTVPPPGLPRPGGQMMAANAMMTRLRAALGETNKLSEKQIPKVKAVFDDQIKKMMDLRNDTTTARTDLAAKRMAIQKETAEALKAVLTPEQFAVYQSSPRVAGRPVGGGGAAPAPGN